MVAGLVIFPLLTAAHFQGKSHPLTPPPHGLPNKDLYDSTWQRHENSYASQSGEGEVWKSFSEMRSLENSLRQSWSGAATTTQHVDGRNNNPHAASACAEQIDRETRFKMLMWRTLFNLHVLDLCMGHFGHEARGLILIFLHFLCGKCLSQLQRVGGTLPCSSIGVGFQVTWWAFAIRHKLTFTTFHNVGMMFLENCVVLHMYYAQIALRA